jgi:uncharacterized membrane protein
MSAQRTGTVQPRRRPAPARSPRGRTSRPSPQVLRRRRLVVGGLALGVVLAIALVTAFVWPGFARSDDPAPAVTVTAPAPTPTVEPSGRPENQTAFLGALPDTVLQLAVRGAAENPGWIEDLEAIEAWDVTYADGPDPAAATAVVSVTAGQWDDADSAGAALEALLAEAGEPTAEGDVTVGEETAGEYAVTPAADAGTSVVTWRNGTAVLQATGPSDLVEDFYSAFPL